MKTPEPGTPFSVLLALVTVLPRFAWEKTVSTKIAERLFYPERCRVMSREEKPNLPSTEEVQKAQAKLLDEVKKKLSSNLNVVFVTLQEVIEFYCQVLKRSRFSNNTLRQKLSKLKNRDPSSKTFKKWFETEINGACDEGRIYVRDYDLVTLYKLLLDDSNDSSKVRQKIRDFYWEIYNPSKYYIYQVGAVTNRSIEQAEMDPLKNMRDIDILRDFENKVLAYDPSKKTFKNWLLGTLKIYGKSEIIREKAKNPRLFQGPDLGEAGSIEPSDSSEADLSSLKNDLACCLNLLRDDAPEEYTVLTLLYYTKTESISPDMLCAALNLVRNKKEDIEKAKQGQADYGIWHRNYTRIWEEIGEFERFNRKSKDYETAVVKVEAELKRGGYTDGETWELRIKAEHRTASDMEKEKETWVRMGRQDSRIKELEFMINYFHFSKAEAAIRKVLDALTKLSQEEVGVLIGVGQSTIAKKLDRAWDMLAICLNNRDWNFDTHMLKKAFKKTGDT